MLAFLEKVIRNSGVFEQKVRQIGSKIGINPNWLMLVMWIESRLNPAIDNPITGAAGLIQFMPDTARQYGTTVEQLRRLNAIDQLDYVYKYLSVFKGKLHSFVDTYFAVFFPRAIGKSPDFVMQAQHLTAEQIAKANRIYDLNHDGKITVAEVKQALSKFIPQQFAAEFGPTPTSGNVGEL